MKSMSIKRGRHYATPFPWPKFICDDTYEKKMTVIFGPSTRYYIGSDQNDINKLFGISYGMHHTDSDRIGWRYVIEKDCIELLTYSYVGGVRTSKHLDYVRIGDEVEVSLKSCDFGRRRTIEIKAGNKTYRDELPCEWHFFNYTLGLYFGGNVAAPHDIIIEISDVS